jgi:hypothetical protein
MVSQGYVACAAEESDQWDESEREHTHRRNEAGCHRLGLAFSTSRSRSTGLTCTGGRASYQRRAGRPEMLVESAYPGMGILFVRSGLVFAERT